MTHPAAKYDPLNQDFPSPEDERRENQRDTIEAVVFLLAVVFSVLTAAVAVVVGVSRWVSR